MLPGVLVLRGNVFKFTSTSNNNQNGTTSLWCACDHIFDSLCVLGHQWCSNNTFTGLRYPQGDIRGYIAFTFSLPFIEAGIIEGVISISAASFSNIWFFCWSTTSAGQMASCGKLARIYMSNNNDVDMNQFLSILA